MVKKEQRQEILKQLEIGMSVTDACILAGVGRNFYYDHIKTDKVWIKDVERAQAACKQRNVVRIQNASKKSWTAAAWWLERKHPEEFAEQSRIQLTGAKGRSLQLAPREFDWTKFDLKTVKAIAKIAAHENK